MEFGLQPLGFMEFLQNNNHQAVYKILLTDYIYIYIVEERKNFKLLLCHSAWMTFPGQYKSRCSILSPSLPHIFFKQDRLILFVTDSS